jgi:hypothetical protein
MGSEWPMLQMLFERYPDHTIASGAISNHNAKQPQIANMA